MPLTTTVGKPPIFVHLQQNMRINTRSRARQLGAAAGPGSAAATDQALARALAGRRVLIVYGLIGNLLAAMRPLGADYMATQAAWLKRDIGAEVSVVRLPTAGAVADNALRIAAALLADQRPAVVIAHSKGGLEVLAALMAPRVAARCAAFIAIQSPFFGSPVADALVAAAPLRITVAASLQLLRAGSGAGLRDLTTAARKAWMREQGRGLKALLRRVPVVCCTTALTREAIGPDRRYLPLARWIERRGAGPSDGLVPVSSALLPGARHIVLRGGHRSTVSKGQGRDPVGLLRRLLSEALL